MHDRESLRRKLGEFLERETGEPQRDLNDLNVLREGLGLDSVDLVSLVMQLECQFRVRLSGDELALVRTVGDVLDLLQSKLTSVPHKAAA